MLNADRGDVTLMDFGVAANVFSVHGLKNPQSLKFLQGRCI